jgi:hypothetical protein
MRAIELKALESDTKVTTTSKISPGCSGVSGRSLMGLTGGGWTFGVAVGVGVAVAVTVGAGVVVGVVVGVAVTVGTSVGVGMGGIVVTGVFVDGIVGVKVGAGVTVKDGITVANGVGVGVGMVVVVGALFPPLPQPMAPQISITNNKTKAKSALICTASFLAIGFTFP